MFGDNFDLIRCDRKLTAITDRFCIYCLMLQRICAENTL